jgi:7,8-dihydropterin-6-yl-methyl-4-(beta-D-ribofuranosyl)aminobenzene 5'-phosphate synthase
MGAYLGRRMFVFGSAALFTQAALFRKASAQTIAPGGSVPTIDSLTITVVMDSSHDIFLRAPAPKAVRIRRTPGVDDWRKTLHNQWGLSLALESKAGGDTRRVLLDFGYQPETLLENLEMLKVDPAKLDAIVVSHGHFDHFGGLVGFLQKHRAAMRPDLTLYVGGEENFCVRKRRTQTPNHFSDWGTLDRRDIDAQRVNIVMCEKPTVIAGHAFSSGTIGRAGFEKVLPNTMVIYGRQGEIGCNPSAGAGRDAGKPVHDEHIHEHATCFNLRERGLVVITSCGHAGIINTVRQAMAASGVRKLHALLGGFHLAPADDAYLRQSVSELKALDPDVVIPMHCSGINFLQAMREQMPDRLAMSTTGSIFSLGA